ncbi:MAG TPA: SDR family oxidoreductase [Bryobacteraceae bacterium]|nr:SDR family oxidoreductase [Bryobacteraceae bacterium]
MKHRLKKVSDQVIVITGASSGIGLATARMAASRGARVVAVARNEEALREICRDIRSSGGDALHVVADVGNEGDLRRVSQEAISRYGGFDTWVNNAGVSTYGKLEDVPIEDARRIFETNFWGVVYGSAIAVENLRSRGGALINVGSVVSDTAVPLQGFYSATKHAVKGYTDALRMEIEHDKLPVSVTLIKPGAIDTPYTQHAGNYLGEKPTHTPPVYHPDLVAEAILHAAENPVRDLLVGGGAKLMSTMARYAPRLNDKYMEKIFIPGNYSGKPVQSPHDGVHQPSTLSGEVRGDYEGMVRRASGYTSAAMHPLLAGAVGLGASLALAALVRNNQRTSSSRTGFDARSEVETTTSSSPRETTDVSI